MIKVNNLDKYFFKHKKNEIHVINNVSLDLPEKGLIALFGPSGGGKTTLLNVIGGLDKAQGSIYYDDQNFSTYNMRKWDHMRSHDIGYIFQNYLLVGELSVYENIKMTLEMIGIKDKTLIDNRIDYLLESVGLKNYKRRRASQLSGGQQQRVAIARALAKNPKVIIADEPTGNLDSRNTVEIMNIIKKISEDKLVLLVTHEPNIANNYADRIIKIEDGKLVSDVINDKQNAHAFIHHSDIYLEDLEKTTFKQNDVSVELYGDFKPSTMKLVHKDGTIYIDLGVDQKVVIIDASSETKLISGKQEAAVHNEATTFDYSKHFEKPTHKTKFSFITLKRSFILAFNQILNASRRRRFLLFGFMLSGVLIALMSSWMLIIFDGRNNQFTYPKEELKLNMMTITPNALIGDEAFIYDLSFELTYEGVVFDQINHKPSVYFEFIPAHIRSATFIHGKDVSKDSPKNEITLDKSVANRYLSSSNDYLKVIGYKLEDLVNTTVILGGEHFTIVGITDFNYGYSRIHYSTYKKLAAKNHMTSDATLSDQELIDLYDSTNPNVPGKVYSRTPIETKAALESKNIKVFNDYQEDYKAFQSGKQALFNSIIMVMFVVSGLIWLSLYFIIRSNLFQRIDEIKVYRALGVKRMDITKIFLVEVFVLTTLTSLVGFLVTMYFIINNNFFSNVSIVLHTPVQMLLAIGFMYTFNILFGTLPVIGLLRKTPAAIIAQAEV